MSSTLIIKTLLLFVLFSGFSLITSLMANEFNEAKPTEESYLKSPNYIETKQSYEDAMVSYDSNVKSLGSFSAVLPVIGLGLSISYYVLTKRQLMKQENK